MRNPEKIRRRDKVDIEQKAEMLTTAYIHSYNLALKEVKKSEPCGADSNGGHYGN